PPRVAARRTDHTPSPPEMPLDPRADGAESSHRAPRVRFDVNADGERGRDVQPDQSGLFRVLAAGGSSVECLALTEEASWPGALERILNNPDHLRLPGCARAKVWKIGRCC